jgi:hypothetical protein
MHRPIPRLVINLPAAENVKIIIVIVTYNSEEFVDDLFASLVNQDYDLSRVLLIVVDNASRDNTVEKVLSHLSQVKNLNWMVIKLSKNYGFVYGNNVALRFAQNLVKNLKRRTVLLLNPDVKIVDKHFLKRLEILSNKLPIVGFATITGDGSQLDSLGAYIDYLGNPADPYGIKISSIANILKHLPLIFPVTCVYFAAVSLRGDMVESLGLLRPFYVMYFDDIEYCFRAWSKGIPIFVYKDFLIWHFRGYSRKPSSPGFRNEKLKSDLEVYLHGAKNWLLFTYEYLGIFRFILRNLLYIIESFVFRQRKYLGRASYEALKVIIKYRLKPKKIPKNLIPFNVHSLVAFWVLKCLIQRTFSTGIRFEGCLRYGVQRAWLEYIVDHLLHTYLKHHKH